MQNKKERRNHIYLDTSSTMAQKSDEIKYCSKDATTPRATKFTSSTWGSYKLGGDNVVYTVHAMVYSSFFN